VGEVLGIGVGLLALPPGTDETAFERAGYVSTLYAARRTYGPGVH
jgi:hypothetical protein